MALTLTVKHDTTLASHRSENSLGGQGDLVSIFQLPIYLNNNPENYLSSNPLTLQVGLDSTEKKKSYFRETELHLQEPVCGEVSRFSRKGELRFSGPPLKRLSYTSKGFPKP